jgi:hypothetical protein
MLRCGMKSRPAARHAEGPIQPWITQYVSWLRKRSGAIPMRGELTAQFLRFLPVIFEHAE